MGYGQTFSLHGAFAPSTSSQFPDAFQVTSGNGAIQMNLEGPAMIGGIDYGLESLSYCLFQRFAPGFITNVSVVATGPSVNFLPSASDSTARSVVGCYSVMVNNTTATSFTLAIVFDGGGGLVEVSNVTATWAPASAIPLMLDQGATSLRAMALR